jgi:hypothetical protein
LPDPLAPTIAIVAPPRRRTRRRSRIVSGSSPLCTIFVNEVARMMGVDIEGSRAPSSDSAFAVAFHQYRPRRDGCARRYNRAMAIVRRLRALLVLVTLMLGAQSQAQAPAPVLLVLGDSISAGYGLAKEGWVDLLAARLRETAPRARRQRVDFGRHDGGRPRAPARAAARASAVDRRPRARRQ